MASLSTSDRHVSIHLSDRALTPLISSSRPQPTSDPTPQSQAQSQALSSITSTAITAYDSASRLGLGLPQRIMIETRNAGPVILHSYLNPQPSQLTRPRSTRNRENGRGIVEQAREDLRPVSGTSDGSSAEQRNDNEVLVNGVEYGKDSGIDDDDAVAEESAVQQPPLLIASVVAANTAEAGEARRAAVRLERMGRDFQRQWAREQEEQLVATPGEDG